MRSSDWSSDVCSSDLFGGFKTANDKTRSGAAECGRIQPCPGRSPKTQAVKECRHDFYASFRVQVVQIGPRTRGTAANKNAISRGEQVTRLGKSLISLEFGQYLQLKRFISSCHRIICKL